VLPTEMCTSLLQRGGRDCSDCDSEGGENGSKTHSDCKTMIIFWGKINMCLVGSGSLMREYELLGGEREL
jgi:hypothetical protein